MKKTIIIILAVLPIVLLIAIGFAGRIFSTYHHVSVEKVAFVDSAGSELEAEDTLVLGVGETKATYIRVYPDLASNKAVTYTSQDESVCTVDAEGRITGVSLGTCTVLVKTYEGSKSALLTVKVTDDHVRGVTLDKTELTLPIGGFYSLTAAVYPYSALNKGVSFTTDAPAVVSVNANGRVTALTKGVATVTVTTQDGGHTATCTVTVTDTDPPIVFDFADNAGVEAGGDGYIVTTDTVNLSDALIVGGSLSASDVRFKIIAGVENATLDGGILTFTRAGIVRILVYTGSEDAPDNQIELRMLHPIT